MVYTEKRPWGHFELFNKDRECTVKLIYVRKNRRLSLQYHNGREESWKIISGSGKVTIGKRIRRYKAGDSFRVRKLARHRIAADTDTVFLEVAYGKFDEKDIVRLEDDYGRVK